MSEEILRALAQLYAIIAKQDGGVTDNEREFVIKSFRKKINQEAVSHYVNLYDDYSGFGKEKKEGEKEKKLTSVKDSVKTLGICRKINKTLTQKQKVVVLVELLEMVNADDNFTPQRKQIIETVSEVFNIEAEEHKSLVSFVLSDEPKDFDNQNFLIVSNHEKSPYGNSAHLYADTNGGYLAFHHVASVDMIFLKHNDGSGYQLNGTGLDPKDVILFPHGSILKSKKGNTFFYSDISAQFHKQLSDIRLSFNVTDLEYKFPSGKVGIREANLSEGPGKLLAIMGASGAGKTTLLNVLAGLEKPSKGQVVINGIDLHHEPEKLRGFIGYIPQDDLLIEELTVFENLYYNASLCFKDQSKEEITAKVEKVLDQLGLLQARDLKVGNALNKSISGGQRKRLNIALELIREPRVMFVDEPTSGLSSRDSENVIDLLKELSLKGTLIFVVIHQPSSDIYKMFDKVLILDTGGYTIYYGHPVQAVNYFKKASLHADHEKGQCEACGNVNPELIFNIIEEKVVDEYGNYTDTRKINTDEWVGLFQKNFQFNKLADLADSAPEIIKLPSKIKQYLTFTLRDFYSKISNQQYLLINLLEAPLLALILAFIIRYNNTSEGTYLFRYNENIPAYLLMSIVVAIFMGLSVSAEELIRDRKIQKRESLLNLSRLSYLNSKITILFSLSAIQTLTFVLVGNSILEIKGMYLSYWFILFTCSCSANVMGLILSSVFNSPVTVYIMIPLFLIPQMILSGAMFSFEKINDVFKNKESVPVVADMMLSRWGFEALAVNQFTDNEYEKLVYPYEQIEAIANYNLIYVLPDLKDRINYNRDNKDAKGKDTLTQILENNELISREISKRSFMSKNIQPPMLAQLGVDNGPEIASKLLQDISELEVAYNSLLSNSTKSKEKSVFEAHTDSSFNALKDLYQNEDLSDFVRNTRGIAKLHVAEGGYAPGVDLVYFLPENIDNPLDYRTHFCAPKKHFAGMMFNTTGFNMSVIWVLTLILFVALYFNLPEKIFATIINNLTIN